MAKDLWRTMQDQHLSRSQDLQAIASYLNIDTVLGKLTRFWKFAGDNSNDGLIRETTVEAIDSYTNATGMTESLIRVGWCKITADGLAIVAWQQAFAKEQRRREQTAERVRRLRERRRNERPFVQKELPFMTSKPEPTPPPIGEPKPKVTPSAAPKASPQTHIWGKPPVQLNSITGEWLGINADLMTLWTESCPAVHLASELKKAAMWCIGNKARGRKSDYKRFLTSWLQRCQDRGGNSPDMFGPLPTKPAVKKASEIVEVENETF